MSPLDINPFSSAFDGTPDNDLFFAGINNSNHLTSSSSASRSLPQFSGLRLQQDNGHAYVYVVNAYGLTAEDFQMTLERTNRNSTIIYVSNRKEFRNNHADHQHQHGTKSISPTFRRLLSLGPNVDADRISAFVENGVVTITVPKLQPQEPPHICIALNRLTARA